MKQLLPGVFKSLQYIIIVASVSFFQGCTPEASERPGWPAIGRATKPWSRWWWHGSDLTKEGITSEMEAYQKAGIGGLEITPIYGVLGAEDKFVDYLSPQWIELLVHTLKEADRLGMGIDMATGTGWPFGGPWVKDADACKDLNYKIYEVKGGGNLSEKVEFIQQSYLRAIGNPIYELTESNSPEQGTLKSIQQQPTMRLDPKNITIQQLVEPIGANKNLQALALEQIKFEKPLALQVLMAYGASGKTIDLTDKVDASGKLIWVAPEGNWKLYAFFEGWHGKMVERAGPGGEGNVIDHFSAVALKHYLQHFDSAFSGINIKSLRAFFNDSYEVDDALGTADWTPTLFEEFRKLKGYDLRDHLPALFGNDTPEHNERILCDYRETISELLLKNFTLQWKSWAHDKSAIIRNQAHGSPSNILDLYAAVDIPEIEGIEPLRIKMASSAGNVTGKKLISSESATWLNEHFQSNLCDIKVALDRFMLNGVNHIFYHGTTYSPPEEPWPGRLFYAAVHLNPKNPLWNDFDQLNSYVARCQSFLQSSVSDNDVLLYYPIYDRFSTPGKEMLEHFDGIEKQFANTAFERAAKLMYDKGYSFDYISDKQIEKLTWTYGSLKSEGGGLYKTIVIPQCRYIPLTTLKKIVSLAEEGAVIILLEGLPGSISGFGNMEENKASFEKIVKKLKKDTLNNGLMTEIVMGTGKMFLGDSLEVMLRETSVRKEAMVNRGIQFLRKKKTDHQGLFFIANSNSEPFKGWLPLKTKVVSTVIYDPMNGEWGTGKVRKTMDGGVEVYVQLTSRQTLIIETYEVGVEEKQFQFFQQDRAAVTFNGRWKVSFFSGGPTLPEAVEPDSLTSWTNFGGNDYSSFSGTAVYTITFPRPEPSAEGWELDLGVVKESAEVFINGKPIGTLIGPVYQLYIGASMLEENNLLEVKVSNLMANRISDMDRRKELWKKFYNVNFPARKAENRKNGIFDASHWGPMNSGLLGPVKLTPVSQVK